MKKKLFKIIIKTTLISSILTFFLVAILQIINSDRHSKNCYMPFYTELLSFFFVWFLSFSIFPMFFNLYKKIRNSFLLSFISFYFLLIAFTIFFLFDETMEFKENPIYFASLFLPYHIVLYLNFISWRKSIAKF